MDVGSYFSRLDYAGSSAPTRETLEALHRAHLRRVPFENLSIHRGEPIVLDEASLFDKVVRRRRGGFCYELNGLFAALLTELGFRVHRLAARVYKAQGGLGIPFDHMTLRVDLDEPWLADVGFGDSFERPLRLDERGPQDGGPRRFRIEAAERDDEGEGGLALAAEGEGGLWPRQYRFTLASHPLAAFEGGCRYHQTSPDSSFTRRRVASMATETGRVTFSEGRLIVTEAGRRTETPLADEGAVTSALADRFGLVL